MEIVTKEALRAISVAVEEGHSVFCLEQLGVSTRLLNLLHTSGIRTIGDLMDKSPDHIKNLPSLGDGHFRSLMSAIAKYHMIESDSD